MSDRDHGCAPGEARGDGGARHGSRTEVNWDGGRGRQPYSNQGSEEQQPATAGQPVGGEFEAGDRGDYSGRNLEQLEQVKKKP